MSETLQRIHIFVRVFYVHIYFRNTGLLVLCEVALGDSHCLVDADSNMSKENLPPGKHSVKGMGLTGPIGVPKDTPEGFTVPTGPLGDTGLVKKTEGFTLAYNEYIVYDVSQIKMRYLAKIKFQYDV